MLVQQGHPQALAVRARVLQLVGSLATQTQVFEDMMSMALSSAVRLGRERGTYHEYFTTFGPTTVQMKRVENAIIGFEPERALHLAEAVPSDLRSTSDNRNRHLLDVANARVMLRDYDPAFEILAGLSHEAPEWLPNQRYAKEILRSIIDRLRRSI